MLGDRQRPASRQSIHSLDTATRAVRPGPTPHPLRRPVDEPVQEPSIVWCPQVRSRRFRFSNLKLQSAILRNNAAKREYIAFLNALAILRKVAPVVPYSTDQPPADTVAFGGREKHREFRSQFQRSTAFFALLERAPIEIFTGPLRARIQNLIE